MWLPRKCDYQESVTTGQTDRQTPDKVIPMCRYASQATQKSVEKSKMADNVPLAMDLLATRYETNLATFFILIYFTFTRQRFNSNTFYIDLNNGITLCRPSFSQHCLWPHQRKPYNVTFSCEKLWFQAWSDFKNFCYCIFIKFNSQFKVLDKIKHLFGQFNTAYRNMGVCKINGRLWEAFHIFYKPAIFLYHASN